jgi:dTDP-4-dehydrorhamnose 3,5-epimerase
MPFTFRKSDSIPEIVVIEPRLFADERGWVMETFKASEFLANGIPDAFVQDNHSRSDMKGVIRGLHFQNEPAAQGKLVRCLLGAVYDVAVDVRTGSPTYGKWVSIELSNTNHKMVWVPPGFAHGFCTLTDTSEVAYKVTAEYSPPHDRAILWNDPALAIHWPISNPSMSTKDLRAPTLDEADNNFEWRVEEVLDP